MHSTRSRIPAPSTPAVHNEAALTRRNGRIPSFHDRYDYDDLLT
jgi:hypothetical protein